jgi:hypothetical protein
LRRLRVKTKLAGGKRREMPFLRNEEKEKCIQDYVETQTAGARGRVEDSEAAVHQDQDDMTHTEMEQLMTQEPQKNFEEMLVAIGDSVSDLVRSYDGEDGEDENDEETEQVRLREDDKPGGVMGTITQTVPQLMESFRQKQMKGDELPQRGWKDTANFLRDVKAYARGWPRRKVHQ